jgi:hypothetical protein
LPIFFMFCWVSYSCYYHEFHPLLLAFLKRL